MATAIVFPFWKMTHNAQRLRDFLEWNAEAFDRLHTIVVAVTGIGEKYESTPDFCCIEHPDKSTFFSLARTCNYGIRMAINAGYDTIIKTDVDIMFPQDALEELIAVQPGQAICQPYHMVDSVLARHAMTDNRLIADLAMGTISMRAADWDRVNGYDERLEGYGCDDGDIWHRIGSAGIKRFRGVGCYHIAHVSGAVQQEAHVAGDKANGTRTDHHNRESVNPNRLRQNSRIVRGATWKSDKWGIPNAGLGNNPLPPAR